jgi:hypothetical protein
MEQRIKKIEKRRNWRYNRNSRDSFLHRSTLLQPVVFVIAASPTNSNHYSPSPLFGSLLALPLSTVTTVVLSPAEPMGPLPPHGSLASVVTIVVPSPAKPMHLLTAFEIKFTVWWSLRSDCYWLSEAAPMLFQKSLLVSWAISGFLGESVSASPW